VTQSLYLNLGLKLTYLILDTANWPALPVPLKLRHYGAIEMYYYYYSAKPLPRKPVFYTTTYRSLCCKPMLFWPLML